MYSTVLFPMQDLGGINHLLLPHTIFNITSKGKEMVFWQYIFSPFLKSDVIISHVTTKLGVAIKVNEIYFLSKFG